jgi:hypothetical protein
MPAFPEAPRDIAADTEPGHPGSYIPGAANIIAAASATVQDLGPWFGALRFRCFGRRLETHDARRFARRLQVIRAGEALARYDVHFKPVDPLSVRFTLSVTF